MNRPPFRFSPPRENLARFFVALFLCLALNGAWAQQSAPVTTASPAELQNAQNTLASLGRAALARDVNALKFFDASLPADNAPLRLDSRLTHLAVTPIGALARQVFSLSIQRTPAVILSSGTQDLWLSRAPDGTFALTPARFVAPPDALDALLKGMGEEWNDIGTDDSPAVLDLVTSRIGGRWIALRRQRWDGQLSDDTNTTPPSPRQFLQDRMDSAPRGRAIIGHFLLQKGAKNWIGLGASFDDARRLSRSADNIASTWRERILGTEYASAPSHRDFAVALANIGLWNESADEYQKANLLQPGIVSATQLKSAETNRSRDPQLTVLRQIQDERNVGLGADHPQYLIRALKRQQDNTPSVLVALRLALEYSRLADEPRAAAYGREAEDLMAKGDVRPQDVGWVQLLVDHLRERTKLAHVKPSNVLHSALFTARVWPDDPNAISLLAALEEAQHTVYADFGIPMGNTEVIMWHDQDEFAHYTTQFSAQGGSEFVAALTLTKLVSTRSGPLVLGEEINTFTDTHDVSALYGTVAHEYGHVAVRQLSKGRLVPVWFNEGIATSVEGGYEGYINRVRRGVNNGTLLSMRELSTWDVDGERAFMAYSQANSIVDYIVQTWGKNAVLDILRQIGNDVSPEDAFRGVLGVSQADLWNRWVQEGIQ